MMMNEEAYNIISEFCFTGYEDNKKPSAKLLNAIRELVCEVHENAELRDYKARLEKENDKLKAEIEEWKQSDKSKEDTSIEYYNLYKQSLSENEQLKSMLHAKEVKADFNTYCELRECNKKLELEIYQLKSQSCNTCNLKDICLINGSFSIRSCSNYEKMVTK